VSAKECIASERMAIEPEKAKTINFETAIMVLPIKATKTTLMLLCDFILKS
jgi:hypothetical protein